MALDKSEGITTVIINPRRNLSICGKFYVNSPENISVKAKIVQLVVKLEETSGAITTEIKTHPLGSMNI